VIRQEGGTLSYAVLRAADPVLGEPELAETASSTRALEGVVASLAAAGSGDAGDTGQALSQFDIGYVLLPAPINQALAAQLNAAAGVEPLTRAPAYDLWQVAETVARVRVLTADGTTVPVPSGPVGVNAVIAPRTSGTLVLAEAAGGWAATLDGKPLTALAAPVDGWAQGFALPAGGGHLVITRNETARNVSLGCEAVALLVAFVLALPGTRSSAPWPAAAGAGDSANSEVGPVVGRRREHAEDTRSARPEREPQVVLAGVSAEPTLGVTPYFDEGPAPWADLDLDPPADSAPGGGPGTGARDDPAVTSGPVPAAPRRGRVGGQHAARHGKSARRSRGGPADGPEDQGDRS
jgi:hypothetical protein